MRVRCTKTQGDDGWLPQITLGAEYEVLSIECDSYRLIGDCGEPSLFEPQFFSITDPMRPESWIPPFIDEDEEYCGPPEFERSGYWDEFYDGNEDAVALFWRYINRHINVTEQRYKK